MFMICRTIVIFNEIYISHKELFTFYDIILLSNRCVSYIYESRQTKISLPNYPIHSENVTQYIEDH